MNEENNFLQSVENYKDLIAEEKTHPLEDDLFCECNFISKKQIENAARNMIYNDFADFLNRLNVGKACGSCLKAISSKDIYVKLKSE